MRVRNRIINYVNISKVNTFKSIFNTYLGYIDEQHDLIEDLYALMIELSKYKGAVAQKNFVIDTIKSKHYSRFYLDRNTQKGKCIFMYYPDIDSMAYINACLVHDTATIEKLYSKFNRIINNIRQYSHMIHLLREFIDKIMGKLHPSVEGILTGQDGNVLLRYPRQEYLSLNKVLSVDHLDRHVKIVLSKKEISGNKVKITGISFRKIIARESKTV